MSPPCIHQGGAATGHQLVTLYSNAFVVLQWDNDLKDTSKPSPDLDPTEILWHGLCWVIHARNPFSVAELQLQRRVVHKNMKTSLAVIANVGFSVVAAKTGSTSH